MDVFYQRDKHNQYMFATFNNATLSMSAYAARYPHYNFLYRGDINFPNDWS